MAKKNNKEKLTYKQMLAYMDFKNAKMTQKFQEIDGIIGTLGYYLRSYVDMKGDSEAFTKLLDEKQKEALKKQEELGSDAEAKVKKMKKS